MSSNQNGTSEHETFELNSIFLFNMMSYKTLDWPSLTCQWLPNKEVDENGSEFYKLVIGTHAVNEENNLKVLKVNFVNEDDSTTEDFLLQAKSENLHKWVHDGDVNRARYMPQNPSIIATRSSNSNSYLYGRDGRILTLKGHSDEGYGMSWNNNKEGTLATAGFDHKVNLYDIDVTKIGDEIEALRTLNSHRDKVEDVQWHPVESWKLASVGDDKQVIIWDTRTHEAVMKWIAHKDEVNSVDWHKITHNLLLTGGSDGDIHLWDTRKNERPLHTFYHSDPVYRVEWSPSHLNETAFISSGLDNRMILWDVDKIGDDVMSSELEDDSLGIPEKVLEHLGHVGALTDVCWHPDLANTLASVSEDNDLCIWQFNSSLLQDKTN